MNKELRDGLKRNIVVGLQSFKSISEVLNADYERYKTKGKGFGTSVYRGKIILLDIENELDKDYVDDENESLYGNVLKQIIAINEMLDGE